MTLDEIEKTGSYAAFNELNGKIVLFVRGNKKPVTHDIAYEGDEKIVMNMCNLLFNDAEIEKSYSPLTKEQFLHQLIKSLRHDRDAEEAKQEK